MGERRKQRLWMLFGVLCVLGMGGALLLMAMRQHIELYLTPSQLLQTQAIQTQSFRLGGLVQMGSLQTDRKGVGIRFRVTDLKHHVWVHYQGMLPALFKEGKGVVLSGRWQHGVVEATEVLAKHDENYRPPGIKSRQPSMLKG